jgi:hypothetical protein
MALAPVPFLYAGFVASDRAQWRSIAPRLVLYALPVILLLPLQFQNTLNDEPRLTSYGLGLHMLTQAWALTSHLVLPLATAEPLDVFLHSIPRIQWAAGALAIGAGVVLFLFGSRTMKFLLVWTALALAPFTLWGLQHTAPRYVYMAALPYSIILSWLIVALLSSVVQELKRRVMSVDITGGEEEVIWLRGPRIRRLAWRFVGGTIGASLIAAALALGYASSTEVMARNESWSDETVRYGLLRESLLEALPDVPENSRIIIYYGGWVDFWASSVVQAIYEDRSIKVINVKGDRVDSDWPPRKANDLVVYFLGDRFVAVEPPSAAGP